MDGGAPRAPEGKDERADDRKYSTTQLASFAEWDNSYLQHSFPQDVHVLTVHGDADEVSLR